MTTFVSRDGIEVVTNHTMTAKFKSVAGSYGRHGYYFGYDMFMSQDGNLWISKDRDMSRPNVAESRKDTKDGAYWYYQSLLFLAKSLNYGHPLKTEVGRVLREEIEKLNALDKKLGWRSYKPPVRAKSPNEPVFSKEPPVWKGDIGFGKSIDPSANILETFIKSNKKNLSDTLYRWQDESDYEDKKDYKDFCKKMFIANGLILKWFNISTKEIILEGLIKSNNVGFTIIVKSNHVAYLLK